MADALLVVVFAGLGLLSGELVLRFFYPQATFYPRYIESPEYSIELPRNAQLVNAQGDQWKFVYTTNKLGRRGPYIPVENVRTTTNIVALGDSFTFGFGVDDGSVYTDILSDHLGSSYAVINGGMSGWGIDSEIKWYYTTGAQYKPKYVILQFTANDLSDSFTGVTEISGGEFVFHPYAKTKPVWQRIISRSGIIQNSHVYSLLRKQLEEFASSRLARMNNSPIRLEKARLPDAGQDNYLKYLNLFSARLKQQGISLLFLSVTHTDNRSGEYIYDLWKFPRIRTDVERLATEDRLVFVELPLGKMRNYPGSPEGHQWSDKHHRLVGEAVARIVKELESRSKNR